MDYNAEMEKILNKAEDLGEKRKLLLHACCAPCASACVERVKDLFDLTVLFYNPNINTAEEYFKRAEELKRLCSCEGVKCAVAEFEPQEFYVAAKGLENRAEGGERCAECFKLRLNYTAAKAKAEGFSYFGTTLTVSPHKNAQVINQTGALAAEVYGVNFLPSDFKKKGGFLRSIELSKQYGLYRQNYCGCVFSLRD